MCPETLPNRRSVRLPAYDYASYGAYFVTIVAHDRLCMFGDIQDGVLTLSSLGAIMTEEWLATAALRQNVELDEFVVMPNHVHAIVWITDTHLGTTTGTPQRAPTTRRFGQTTRGSLSALINGFKGAVTRRARTDLGIDRVWQRGFYEHVIRTDKALAAIRQYIVDNAAAWGEDDENPANVRPR
ncbi:MAG: transposase [Chloroflexi bacterium]|nr:transposase [Chloroflexota bacterium]